MEKPFIEISFNIILYNLISSKQFVYKKESDT